MTDSKECKEFNTQWVVYITWILLLYLDLIEFSICFLKVSKVAELWIFKSSLSIYLLQIEKTIKEIMFT